MHVLLLRPVPGNERFGFGPFFRIEPLGMEYIAAALEARGHRVTLLDLRFTHAVERAIRLHRPGLVGIACMHALETDAVLDFASRVRRATPDAFLLVGGHSAAAYPTPFLVPDVDAICVDDGEQVVPRVVEALERRTGLEGVPRLMRRDRSRASGRLPDDRGRHGRLRGLRKQWVLVLRGDAAADPRGGVGPVRHAPPALGAGARRAALLRAVLRDLAAVGAERRGTQALVAGTA